MQEYLDSSRQTVKVNEQRRQHSDYIELSIQDEEDEPPDCEEQDNNNQQYKALLDKNDKGGANPDNFFDETEKIETISDIKALGIQAFPSLIISMIGLIFAGDIMDEIQHRTTFSKTPELFILVPILLNLKGNLEMNLAARFSTSSNLGEFDKLGTCWPLIIGNLLLLQVQSLVAGAMAGIASFALGLITKPGSNNPGYYEMMFMTASAMVSACFSAAILGAFMCALIILCRKLKVDPDNIACPMASSTGDIVTLLLLAACASILQNKMDTIISSTIVAVMLSTIPVFSFIVWKNENVKELLFTGWSPIVFAMVISSLAGIILEKFVEQYRGIALLTPVLIGLTGNIGSIYASRISTCFHTDKKENYDTVELALLLMNLLVQAVYMLVIWGLNLGKLPYNIWFFGSYLIVSMLATWISLKIGKIMTIFFWKMEYDPDIYVIPYLTALVDVIGTTLLVGTCVGLTATGAADMALSSSA